MARLSTHRLDARNLICPLPVIRTQERIAGLNDGDVLEIYASDPGALHDIPAWCRVHGHQVMSQRREDDLILITVRVQKQSL